MEARGAQTGKVGLALSGGGFRAAFFHVGVLARLSEIEVLPQIEVISTVSGGSIVGAAYYLLLKRKLDENPDRAITRRGYVEIVEELERCLRFAVQKNIRGRVFANPGKNFSMALKPRYSRSDRIGDLYDRYLYKGAWDWGRSSTRPRKWSPLGPQRQIEMRELPIHPNGERDFKPDRDNAGRDEKVPELLINATTLNTGHNWRFEAVRMGEPLPQDAGRQRVVKEVDNNMRLDQGYFEKRKGKPSVPEPQQDFPLGLAVAASACVPGVFHPLAISKMYRGVRVQLVDGGVQDNQGIQGLLDRGCSHLIVSDASGQLEDKPKPSAGIVGVTKRSVAIATDRIRDEQLVDVLEQQDGHPVMHLRKGLDAKAVAPGKSFDQAAADRHREPGYGSAAFDVQRGVQMALSRIRTDLDFFSDVEASSLELDGYLMSRFELERKGFGGSDDTGPAPEWTFRDKRLEEQIRDGEETVLRTLETGKRKFFRLLFLSPLLAGLRMVVAAAIGAAIALTVHWLASCALAGWAAWVVAGVVLLCLAPTVWYRLSAWAWRLYERQSASERAGPG
jgi:predicted acylesterase/phospholipase RssA